MSYAYVLCFSIPFLLLRSLCTGQSNYNAEQGIIELLRVCFQSLFRDNIDCNSYVGSRVSMLD